MTLYIQHRRILNGESGEFPKEIIQGIKGVILFSCIFQLKISF